MLHLYVMPRKQLHLIHDSSSYRMLKNDYITGFHTVLHKYVGIFEAIAVRFDTT